MQELIRLPEVQRMETAYLAEDVKQGSLGKGRRAGGGFLLHRWHGRDNGGTKKMTR